MNTLDIQLNNAIEEKGFRISPRAPLEDRLVRYMQLSSLAKGEELDVEDARATVQLMMLRNSDSNTWSTSKGATGSSWSNGVWAGRTRSSSHHPDHSVSTASGTNRTVSSTRNGTHPMMRRSQTGGASR